MAKSNDNSLQLGHAANKGQSPFNCRLYDFW